jgi:glycosyltransferase involved in cell wall biosynthesis
MRILCLFQHAPTPGAPGMYRQRRYLAELVRRGWDVDLVSTAVNYLTGEIPPKYARRPYVRETIDGITHHWVRVPAAIHASRTRRMMNYAGFATAAGAVAAAMPRPDVLYISSPPLPVANVGTLLARRFRRPYVLEVRDIWPESAVAVGWLSSGTKLYRALERASCWSTRSAAAVVVPTPGLVEGVRSHGARRVEVVTGAVREITLPSGAREAARRELGVREEQRLFIYIGAIGVANGIDALLDAVERLPDTDRIAVRIVGNGSARPAIEARLRQRPLRHVELLAPVDPERVTELLAAADVGLHLLAPSDLFAAALPNKVLDYLGAHLPFITTTPGLPETIALESGGGFAPTVTALAAELQRWGALTDEELDQRRQTAHAYGLARFGFRPNIDRLESLFHDCIGSSVAERPTR